MITKVEEIAMTGVKVNLCELPKKTLSKNYAQDLSYVVVN